MINTEQTYDVAIPNGTAHEHIAKGSAIIARESPYNRNSMMLHYEGNLYNAENLQRFEDKCLVAALNSRDIYPTAAQMYISKQDFKKNFTVIGQFDLAHRALIMEIKHMALYKAWQKQVEAKADSDLSPKNMP